MRHKERQRLGKTFVGDFVPVFVGAVRKPELNPPEAINVILRPAVTLRRNYKATKAPVAFLPAFNVRLVVTVIVVWAGVVVVLNARRVRDASNFNAN